MDVKILFIALYRALDCIYDEEPNQEFGNFLSDMNPYLFTDRKSADPAVYAEFEEYVNDRQISIAESNDDYGFEIVYNYMKDCTKFLDYFNKISIEEWKDLIEIVKEEESY